MSVQLEMSNLTVQLSSRLIIGIDEAGRGPLAGPVVASAVILDPERCIDGLNDSKQLCEAERERLAPLIREHALAWAVASAEVHEIDTINILQATMLAMRRALLGLTLPSVSWPLHIQVDGNRLPLLHDMPFRHTAEAVVEGDATVPAISAASILAKVARDALMVAFDREHPQYGFAAHKGYGTPAHLRALQQHGPCVLHRRSFAPVRRALGRQVTDAQTADDVALGGTE